MSEEIRCVLMTAPRAPLELRRVPAPRAAAGGAVLEMLASEVCGTDVHLHHGQLAGVPYPIIPGHVSVGRVLETGGALHGRGRDGRSASGRLVTFYDVFGVCGACWHCLVAKAATRCPQRRVYGITTERRRTACSAAGRSGSRSGRACGVLPLPDGVSAEDFMGGGCGLPTGFHAVERAGVALGDTVVVQGSGPVGLNALVFAQLAGALRVLVIGAPARAARGGAPARAPMTRSTSARSPIPPRACAGCASAPAAAAPTS